MAFISYALQVIAMLALMGYLISIEQHYWAVWISVYMLYRDNVGPGEAPEAQPTKTDDE